MKETKATMMKDEEMDMVNGGGWGYNIYHNEDMYKAVGIKTDWTSWYNPFQEDKFKFNNIDITGDTAAKIVFFVHATDPKPGSFTIEDALLYAIKHVDEFKVDVQKANTRP